MSILAAVALLALPQRGGASAQRPITRGTLQVVTTSWLRMNDPAFIRDLSVVRLPGVVSPLQPFELNMSSPGGSAAGSLVNGKPANLNYGALTRGIRPVKLANPVDFGEALENGAPTSSYFENIALQDGTIKVPQLPSGPFRATRVATYLGVLPSGKLKEDGIAKAQGNSELSIPVKAGQAYRVDFAFDPKGLAPKKYHVMTTVNDGTENSVNLFGAVVGPKGKLEITKEAGDIIAVPGKTVTFNLNVKAQGNTPKTQVQIELDKNDAANFRFQQITPQGSVSIKNNAVTTIPITLDVAGNYDRSVTLHLTVKGYDGAETTTFAFPVSIVNQWIDSGQYVAARSIILQGGGGIVQKTTYRRFRMSASGVWQYTAEGPIDNHTFVFTVGGKTDGKQYAVIDPKYSYSGATSGLDTGLGKRFDQIKGSTFNLYEGEVPEKPTFDTLYNGLIAFHDLLKKQGVIDLNEAGYQKMLKELKK